MLTCEVHGATCTGDVQKQDGPDAVSRVIVCEDGYGVLCAADAAQRAGTGDYSIGG